MPNKVIKPTIEPTDKVAPVMTTANIPPINAKGRLTSASAVLRKLQIQVLQH